MVEVCSADWNFACKVENLYIKNTKLLIDADTSSDDNNLLDRMFGIFRWFTRMKCWLNSFSLKVQHSHESNFRSNQFFFRLKIYFGYEPIYSSIQTQWANRKHWKFCIYAKLNRKICWKWKRSGFKRRNR